MKSNKAARQHNTIRMKLNSMCALVIFATAILSCSPPMQTEDLNGYWEITSVTLEDGTERDYTVNAVVDFIEINGSNGTRSKVKPQFDGSFINNSATEEFSLEQGDKFMLAYNTPYDAWKEEILELSSNKMRVKNRDGKVFTYKTFTPFSLKTK